MSATSDRPDRITSPADPALQALCDRLAALGDELSLNNAWPAKQLRLCGERGVFSWFAGAEWGGQAWDERAVAQGYLELSAACLTTTFVITQRTGACQRIERSGNERLQREWLPGLTCGELFATVGISHLTTSRRHLATPVLRAAQAADGSFLLDGFSPWVTGASRADLFVLGATLDDGRQILAAVPANLPGVRIPPAEKLVGLSASQTGPVHCDGVRLGREWLLAGPVFEVMKQGVGARTGGLQTSTLALGLARSAIEFLEREAVARADLAEPTAALRADWNSLHAALLAAADQRPACSEAELRTRANSLVLRATQACLAAAKGLGYVDGHPAGRWCREALFFLVWSCPQPVLNANLCELAGL